MLAFVAAALFVIAFVIRVTETSTQVVFSPTSLMLAGLVFLALHLAGVGSGWSARRSSTGRSSARRSSPRRSGSRR
ncbi:hypothetical protein ACOT81_35935 [Streptomyces sp. WI04-05B]|uniref:hypothetical protein n=1 Tax=Streptomyces TaxID=1883 RepID=UPI0029B8785C|nr:MULTISPECIES: hypothetical protein [unclassified Streptomyces]MDX2548583.1 hypothetical protein [Streptomyces sp. WI04-05B]MDX2588071.1 hypothetical protein [Streptomyces sp. WI04-05A]